MVLFKGNGFDGADLSLLELWIGVSAAVMILFYLAVMSGANPVARRSVKELLGGRVAFAFYGGTLMIGLIVPIGIGLLGLTTRALVRRLRRGRPRLGNRRFFRQVHNRQGGHLHAAAAAGNAGDPVMGANVKTLCKS